MSKNIILFDVDGTLVESGDKIYDENRYNLLNKLKDKYEIGIVGGGSLEKIVKQLDYNKIQFDHYFTECGCMYYDSNLNNIYSKNIREHYLYDKINIIIKKALQFISTVTYNVTGHFIDLRNGIIYISLIGMQATNTERQYFKDLDKTFNIRKNLLTTLREEAKRLNILDKLSINYGGTVGIGVYPAEYDKVQVIDLLKNKETYDKIIYFGDKYDEDGNDHQIINHELVSGYKIDNVNKTYDTLEKLI